MSGAPSIRGSGAGWTGPQERANRRRRGAMLDEALDVVVALWTGADVDHVGTHYRAAGRFLPAPVQRPRIPVWVAGAWPHLSPFRRAARFDGVVPMLAEPGPFDTPPDVYRAVMEMVTPLRPDTSSPFDVVHTHGDPDVDLDRRRGRIAPYGEAGVTWWLEDVGPWRWLAEPLGPWPLDDMLSFVRAGPARV